MIHLSFTSTTTVFHTQRSITSERLGAVGLGSWDCRKTIPGVHKTVTVVLKELIRVLEVSEGAAYSYVACLIAADDIRDSCGLTPAEAGVLRDFYFVYKSAISPTSEAEEGPSTMSFSYFNNRSGNAVVWTHLVLKGFQ